MTISTASASKATDTAIAPGGASRDNPESAVPAGAVEQALAAAVTDAGRIGDLLEVLRTARLWLPLPADGARAINGTAVTLPIVSYLGSDFVPAYSSADLLERFAGPDDADHAPAGPHAPVPHVVVRAADLARLLPASVGIALNAGASESVPVYPPGVSYLATGEAASTAGQISVEPLPVRPDSLLAGIAAGLLAVGEVREAAAAWLSVKSAGEGLLIAVKLDDPADDAVQDVVVGAVERAAWEAAPADAAFPIDVTFVASGELDGIDERVAAVGSPFYRRV